MTDLSRVPGYEEAVEAAKKWAFDHTDGWWESDVAEAAVDAAVPIIIEALAQAAEAEMFGSRMVNWLRGFLVSEVTNG